MRPGEPRGRGSILILRTWCLWLLEERGAILWQVGEVGVYSGMHTRTFALVAGTACSAISGIATAQSYFQLTQNMVSALSRDGRTAVGQGEFGVAFAWTAENGYNRFGLNPEFGQISIAGAVSDDGRFVAGYSMQSQFQYGLYRWSGSGTYEYLGRLPGFRTSHATGISADGSVITGYAQVVQESDTQAFIWTAQGGLRALPVGGSRSQATGMSSDGSKIVGWNASGGNRAFLWSEDTGTQYLPGLSAANDAIALGINSSGNMIAGGARVFEGEFSHLEPVVWTNGTIRNLGVPSEYSGAWATSISESGEIVVGLGNRVDTGYSEAFVWTLNSGFRTMREYLESFGVAIPGFAEFQTSPIVSADGRTFSGIASGPGQLGGGFVATIPTPGVAIPLLGLFCQSFRRRH